MKIEDQTVEVKVWNHNDAVVFVYEHRNNATKKEDGTYTYEDYKKHIRNYWYGELGGRDLVSHSTSEQEMTRQANFGDSSENALNTTVGSTGFQFKCRKCGKKGHIRRRTVELLRAKGRNLLEIVIGAVRKVIRKRSVLRRKEVNRRQYRIKVTHRQVRIILNLRTQ